MLFFPSGERILVLNGTGRAVWEMFVEGCGEGEIASTLVRDFSISRERALRDVAQILADFKAAISCGDDSAAAATVASAAVMGANGSSQRLAASSQDLGTFQFGENLVKVVSSISAVDESLFLRFKHRAVVNREAATCLQVVEVDGGFRVSLAGHVVGDLSTGDGVLACLIRVLLGLEHSGRPLLAHCHAAAVSRGGMSILMPGHGGVGKSTLTAFLLANGFFYLGDDVIGIGEEDSALLPLPSCLSVKSGSWSILETLYPSLFDFPPVDRYDRTLRYVEPQGNYRTRMSAAAPSAIVFATYKAAATLRLEPLPALESMVRLIGAHTALCPPVTQEKLAKLARFVERTPAYELTYSELPSALAAIEDLLASQP